MQMHGIYDNQQVPIRVSQSGEQIVESAQSNSLSVSATVNGKTLNESYKLYDTSQYSEFTLLVTVTKTSAVGDGRIAVRGYMDGAQTISTPDLALTDLNSTTAARLNVLTVTAGSTSDKFILQLRDVEFTALEIYTKAADTGTTVSVGVEILAKWAH